MGKVKILPSGVYVNVPDGALLKFALDIAGVGFRFPCGGMGLCGGCRVKFLEGIPDATEAEKRLLGDLIREGYRLACIAKVTGDCVISIEQEDTFSSSDEDLDDFLNPDFSPAFLCSSSENYLAVDVGTTTIVMLKFNKDSNIKIIKILNPQVKYGTDIVSRIRYAVDNKEGVNILKELVLNEIFSNFDLEDICALSFSGNPVMQDIIAGESLLEYAKYPYDKGKRGFRYIEVMNKNAILMPVIGGFLGGDAVSMIFAAVKKACDRLYPFLVIDIGTNTELFIVSEDYIIGTSLPAGPAFEGYGISCGMPAVDGAIYNVYEDLSYDVIGDAEPRGICGSGLVSLIYALRKKNIIDESGYMKDEKIFLHDNVFIDRRDVRQFQLAKATVFAGVKVLIDRINLSNADIKKIYVAGSFGGHIKPEWMKGLKFFPDDVIQAEVEFMGNTSILGAKYALFSEDVRKDMEDLNKKATYIRLAEDPGFEENYIKGIYL